MPDEVFEVEPELDEDALVVVVGHVELPDLRFVARGPSAARAAPPGITWAKRKSPNSTSRTTMTACITRRMRKAIIAVAR